MNRRERVESVGTMSKPRRVVGSGRVQREPAAWLGGIRHKGGVNLNQALVWNVGTWRLDEAKGAGLRAASKGVELPPAPTAKGEIQVEAPRG
jgi:hypothetical protein